ncbi:MAG TPA: diacylglycerol kinase family protein [Ktedonobacteraceae bacterium]|nr:diacylglycerol kinase family protein [Ktedonobacteraceae bacterium]
MSEARRKAIVIHSPYSGRSARLEDALAHLREAGIEVVEQMAVSELDGLPPQGSYWQKSGINLAIAAGGDGLIGGVITHIAPSGLPLGIMPLGTANDIARSLNIPQDIDLAAQIIRAGRVQEVDVGVAKPSEQAPHLTGKGALAPLLAHISTRKHGYFAHALTIGLNVQFARIATNIATRQRYGRLTYPIAALETLKYRDALDVSLRFEGLAFPTDHDAKQAKEMEELQSISYQALQITVINAPIFGGQWKLSVPNASIHDRLLDIVVIEEIEFSRLNTALTHFLYSLRQDHPSNNEPPPLAPHPAELSAIPGIHHFQARGVLISTTADPRDVTLDGEVRGQTPIYVHLADERLRVVVPQDGDV